jgi:hypothetical protein
MCITEREGTSMKNDCNELIAMLAASVYTSKKNQQLSEK